MERRPSRPLLSRAEAALLAALLDYCGLHRARVRDRSAHADDQRAQRGGAPEEGDAGSSSGTLQFGSGGAASHTQGGALGGAGDSQAGALGSAGTSAAGVGGDIEGDGDGGTWSRGGATSTAGGTGTNSAGANGGKGGNQGVSDGGYTASSGGATSGGSGKGSGGGPSLSGCADLNGNHVSDCAESLVKNSSFESVKNSKPSDWSFDSGVNVTWSPMDAVGGGTSGSALLTSSEMSPLGIGQCIFAHAGSKYDVIAHSFIESSGASGLARVSIAFFAQENCSGSAQSLTVSPFDGTTSSWRNLQLIAVEAPIGVTALQVRLELLKLPTAVSSSVHFDDVLVLSD